MLAFAGGALAVVINGWLKKVPFWWTAQLVAPALPVEVRVEGRTTLDGVPAWRVRAGTNT